MENTKSENTLCKRGMSEIYAECAAEYILPDYKGDVKRILHTEARAIAAGNYSDSSECELGGVVVFDILYLDSENKLSSVNFSTDYSMKLPAKEGFSVVSAEPMAENVSIRLPGPRKMLGRCGVKCTVKTEGTVSLDAEGNTFDEGRLPEVCKNEVKNGRVLRGVLGEREYAEEFFFVPGASIDDVDVITKRADTKIVSVAAKDNAVKVSGEVIGLAIIKNADGAPYKKEIKIPFEESVEVLGATEGSDAFARAQIVSLECPVNPEDDGVRVNVSVILDIFACAYENESAELLTDAYTPLGEVQNSYEAVRYEEFLGSKREVSKISKEISKSETDAAYASDIVYLSTDTKMSGVKIENSQAVINGEIRFSGVACEIYEDGAAAYTSFKFSVPFSEGVNFNTQIPQDASIECSLESCEASVTLDDDNFYAEATLAVSISIFTPHECVRLSLSEVVSESSGIVGANVISVYYPEEGDTLFGVAKRFKTSPFKIAEDNALTAEAISMKNEPESLISVGKLIIKK